MPCMGPDMNYAEQEAKRAIKVIKNILFEEFNVLKPNEKLLDNKNNPLYKIEVREHLNKKNNLNELENIIRKIILDEHMYSF